MKSEEPIYAVVEAILEKDGKRLLIHEPSDGAVARAMKDGVLAWRPKEDSKLVTSEPQVVVDWLLSLKDDDFTLHETFERWPAPVDDLRKQLNETQK